MCKDGRTDPNSNYRKATLLIDLREGKASLFDTNFNFGQLSRKHVVVVQLVKVVHKFRILPLDEPKLFQFYGF